MRSSPTAGGPRGTARNRALGLLAVRWRSREELRRRLTAAGFEAQEVTGALADLERAGLVEDGRFAAEVVRDRAGRRLAGDRAIRSALRSRGVAPQVIEEALEGAGDELERATALASRRAARLTGLPPETTYRRLIGLLMRNGYPPDTARQACAAALEDSGDPAITDLHETE